VTFLSYPTYTLRSVEMPPGLSSAEQVYFFRNRRNGLFFNQWGVNPNPTAAGALKWKTQKNVFAAEKRQRPVLPLAPNPMESFGSLPSGTRVMWLGHASFLIELDGVHILTDPVFSTVAGTVRRQVAYPLAVEEMPEIDIVLISHDHFDHLDLASLKVLGERFGERALLVVPARTRPLVQHLFTEVVEVNWWRQLELGAVRFTFVPAQHWGRRGATDLNVRLWGSWVLEGSRRIFFAADSGYFGGFSLFAKLFGAFDLALMPLGAYEPRWYLSPQHMNPEESWKAFGDLGARHFLPLHWGTYDLANEPIDQGPRLLNDLLKGNDGAQGTFHVLAHGGSLGFEGDDVRKVHDHDEALTRRLNAPGTVFDGLSNESLRIVLERLRPLAAQTGETIIEAGDGSTEMFYLLSGRVDVTHKDTRIGSIGPGGMVGEMAFFTGAPRAASATAVENSEFLLMSMDDYLALKHSAPDAMWKVERDVLATLSARVVEVARRFEVLTRELGAARTRQHVKLFARLSALLADAPAALPLPDDFDVVAALQGCPFFEGALPAHVASVAAILQPRRVEAGTRLTRQGAATEACLLIEGEAEVVVEIPRKQDVGVYPLTVLGPGTAVGLLALFDNQAQSPACVTTVPTTVLALDPTAWRRLAARDDETGSTLRVAVIRALCHQLQSTNQQFISELERLAVARNKVASGKDFHSAGGVCT